MLGETVILDDRPFEVFGVMPSSFASLPIGGELWLPMEMDPNAGRYEGINEIQTIGRLSAQATPRQATDELRRIVESRGRDFAHLYSGDFGNDVSLIPLHETVTSDFRKPLLVLQVAVVFVLLMACVNVANIALAGASTRTTELALRSALGASRGQIVRQLTTEAALIATLGSGVGLMTAFFCLPLMVSALPIEKPGWLTIAIDGKVLLFTAALALLSVVAFSVLPALWSSRATSQPTLKTSKSASRGSVRLRAVLVASEMALAVVLIVGAGLMLKSFLAVLEEDLGFTTERVVTMRLHPSPAKYRESEQNRIFYREVLERIRSLPGIDEAGIARRLPLQGAWFTRVHVESVPSTNDRGHAVQWTPADPGYFRALGLDVVEGSGFDGSEYADTQPVALVNETFATRLGQNVSPVGRRIRFTGSEDEWMTVVGVVRDVKQNGPRGFAFPMIFRPFEQSPIRSMRMVVRTTGEALAASASIRGTIWEVDASVPISEVSTMEQILSSSLAEPRLPVLGLTIFAAIALLLGIGGLYGVVSFVASQRTFEIGVLFALGAQRGPVLRVVMSAGMKPVFMGMFVGLAGSVVLSRFIASLLFEVSPTDPMVLASVIAVLTLVALGACYVPARRASRIDPTTALRSE
ncbi:MAG: FtsX-like permease family protein [Acidobacteria bacterium]|nr:MAG: FtsX-like permease family protein [Acidobacteriota bacterium]